MTQTVNLFNVGAQAGKSGWTGVVAPGESEYFTQVKKPAKAAQDTVAISELGKALSGKAAELFSSFDDKTRGVLENIVKAGVMSAEEVNTALHARATFALFERYIAETPPDAEQQLIRRQAQQANGLRQDQSIEIATSFDQLDWRSSQISLDQQIKNLKTIEKNVANINQKSNSDDDQAFINEENDLAKRYLKISIDNFKRLGIGEDDYRGVDLISEQSLRMQDKLTKILDNMGVDMSKMMYDEWRYAAGVDMPGIGKQAPPTWEQWKSQHAKNK